MLRPMSMRASGRLHVIDDTKQVSDRFQKREFVLELQENPRYPQHVQFQLTGNRCGAIDDFQVGDMVEVEFSLRGREWTSPRGEVKYFNSLDVGSVRAMDRTAGPDDEPPLPDEPPPDVPGDDIPF
jgi:hypothetical protein